MEASSSKIAITHGVCVSAGGGMLMTVEQRYDTAATFDSIMHLRIVLSMSK